MDSTFSTTQATNYVVFASAIGILIAKVAHPATLTQDDIVTILSAFFAAAAAVVSFVNRYKKGDLTPLGSRK